MQLYARWRVFLLGVTTRIIDMDDQVTQVFRDGEQHRSLVFEIYEIYPASGLSTLGEKKKENKTAALVGDRVRTKAQ